MSPRFPVPDSSDSKYTPRERSPPRSLDRRSSAPYGGGSLSLRNNDANHRSFEANCHPNLLREPPREPPRGPKALVDGPRAPYAPRGRSFASRGDYRDRDYRDPPAGRGLREREWTYRGSADGRDRRVSPPGRGRTRSPPQRDGSRDMRTFSTREADWDRSRRDSLTDVAPSSVFRGRGGFRGRGRGDFEYLPRGRTSYAEEREAFRPRSRSRERTGDRNQRDVRDRDYDLGRREDEIKRGWDDRERDFDKHRKEPPPFRPDSRNSTGTQLTPSTPLSATGGATNQLNVDRASQGARRLSSDSSRRSSAPNTAGLQGTFKDLDRPDALSYRADKDRDRFGPQPPSSPPQAPQVPAFGSIVYKPSFQDQDPPRNKSQAKDEVHSVPTKSSTTDVARLPPSAPKAELLSNAPTAPKAEKHSDKSLTGDNAIPAGRALTTDRDRYGSAQGHPITPSKASNVESTSDSRSTAQPPLRAKQGLDSIPARSVAPQTTNQPSARTGTLQSTQSSRRSTLEEQDRIETLNAIGNRSIPQETSIQPAPIKIPTGPRAERAPPSIRQIVPPVSRVPIVPPISRVPPIRHQNPQRRSGQISRTWVRPGLNQGLQYVPRALSIMNTVPTKRDHIGDERPGNSAVKPENRDSEASSWPDSEVPLKVALDEAKAVGEQQNYHVDNSASTRLGYTDSFDLERRDDGTSPEPGFPSPMSSISRVIQSQATSEDMMDLNEEDFEEAERKYHRELQALEAKRPPDLLHHSKLLALLEECDALASTMADIANKTDGELACERAKSSRIDLGLPSPKAEDTEKQDGEVQDTFHTPPLLRPETPPVESLPFLTTGPPTPFSGILSSQDEEDYAEAIRSRILEELTAQHEQLHMNNERTKTEFANSYRSWRAKNDELEEQEKMNRSSAPTIVTSAPAVTSIVQQTSIQGRRQNRNASNLDLDMALEQSMKTYQEEQQNNQLAEIGPNLDKEALIPDMLDSYDSVNSVFNDRNNLIESQLALQTLAFVPKRDDFTPEEREIFVENYILNPKKWGTIANALSGRDYQDCIQHYYLTKGRVEYKEKEKAFSRIKKGRRGPRGPQGRAKSNALIPSYDGNIEFDATATAVTETGRPKRTAAPIFGSAAEAEIGTAATTPIRRNNPGTKFETSSEMGSEKPKRTRINASKEKGSRRGRAHLLAPGPSPQKAEKVESRSKSKEPKPELDPQTEEIEGAHLLAGLQNPHSVALPQTQSQSQSQSLHADGWTAGNHVPASAHILLQKSQQNFESPPHPLQQKEPAQPRGAGTASSYWSVPESRDFQLLLGHYGTDWHAIANAMKTKTHTMVSSKRRIGV